MGLEAQKDFPAIDFSKSVMVGDSISDMEFGEALGMHNVYSSRQTRTKVMQKLHGSKQQNCRI